jgi:hypothetical protein
MKPIVKFAEGIKSAWYISYTERSETRRSFIYRGEGPRKSKGLELN